MGSGKHTYFASDFHLGLKAGTDPLERERLVVRWLSTVENDAEAIYLVGDIFDFWWEYRRVVPKGFTRFLGKISEMTDSGIKVHFFTGNHDMWVGNYLHEECGMTIHTGEQLLEMDGKKFYIAHGEGLGTDDMGYRILLWIFRNRLLRRLYSSLHPGIGLGIGHRWSSHSRLAKNFSEKFAGPENEALFKHAHKILEKESIDFFIFGHRHITVDEKIGKNSRILIMGNWFSAPVYVDWDGTDLRMIEVPYH